MHFRKDLPGRRKPDPSVFRMQRDIMASQGRGPRSRVFQPTRIACPVEKKDSVIDML